MDRDSIKSIYTGVGQAIVQWNNVVVHLEIAITVLNGEKSPGQMGIQVAIVNMPDNKKISRFIKKYRENREYHVLDSKEVEKLLSDGLESRHYFAHHFFLYNEETRELSARVEKSKRDRKDIYARFTKVIPEELFEKLKNIENAYKFTRKFIDTNRDRGYIV